MTVGRLFIAATEGLTYQDLGVTAEELVADWGAPRQYPTPEPLLEHWSAICDEREYYVPANVAEYARARLQHTLSALGSQT